MKVDPELHAEILSRYAPLNIAPYRGFVNPVYTPVRDAEGRIIDHFGVGEVIECEEVGAGFFYCGAVFLERVGVVRRIEPGKEVEESHMRNRKLISEWVFEHGSRCGGCR